MGSPYGLCKCGADIHDLQPVPQQLFFLAQGHRVSDYYRLQLAALDDLDGIAAEDAVGHDGHDLLGAVRDQRRCGLGQRAARVRHVVHEDARHVLDGTDEDHARDLVRAGALLVDKSKGEVEAIGDGSCSSWG